MGNSLRAPTLVVYHWHELHALPARQAALAAGMKLQLVRAAAPPPESELWARPPLRALNTGDVRV